MTENFNEKLWEEEIYKNGNQLNKYPFDSVVSFIYRNFPDPNKRHDTKILEIGCGAGNNLWFASREGFDTTGIDGSKSAINFAKERFAAEGLKGNFIVGDFAKHPMENSSFDLVIDRCALSCCNFVVVKEVIKEVYRVLNPGGMFYFSPYSQAHSSFASGKLQPDGMVDEITNGTLTGLGGVCFYSQKDILEAFDHGWHIESIKHKETREIFEAKELTHAEWEVIVRKN